MHFMGAVDKKNTRPGLVSMEALDLFNIKVNTKGVQNWKVW